MLILPFLIVSDLPEIDGKPVFTHLTVFIYGFILAADPRFRRALDRNKVVAFILGVITFSIMAVVEVTAVEFTDNSLEDVSYFILRNCNLWFWLVAILGFGGKYLNNSNRVLSYAREAAYPFYVLHQTVIVLIGFYAVQWSADPLLKYLVVMACSLVATIGIYDLAVRRTNLTRFMFGMKPARAARAPTISPAGAGSP